MLKKSLVLACFSVICGAHAEQDTITININSKISIDKNIEGNLLNATVKEYSKKITKELSEFRGVTEVETTVDSDCGSVCKREVALSKECGIEKDETSSTSQAEIKCGSCGQILKSCSSCGKCSSCSNCSSCSSCCK